MDWTVSVAGFFVGGLIGMTGMGSGSLVAPLLILGFGVPPLQAVGSDLVYSSVTKLVAAAEHIRLRTVDFRAVRCMAAASLPASLLAVWAVSSLDDTAIGADELLLPLLGVALIVGGLALLGQAIFRRAVSGAAAGRPWLLGAGGALLGGILGATAAGSGTLGVALLSLATRLDARRVVGTVIVHATVLATAGALAHLALGNVRPALTAALLVGSIPGVVIGSRLTLRVPEPALRAVLAVLLIVIGARIGTAGAYSAHAAAAPGAPPAIGSSAVAELVPQPATPDRSRP